ncbi:MAG: hypothetical protein U0270_25600 [Labilithrix sp.]
MSDELLLPQVPEPKPEDPEDVSWALSTAEAMWARGDHSEGVKWVRRAAEAAADAENDARFMELSKAAADLAQLLTKRGQSRASIHIDDSELADDEPAPPPPPPAPKPSQRPPPPKAAPAAPKAAAASVTKQVTTPSRPPAPLPSSASRPPPAMTTKPATTGKPLGTNTKSVPPPKPAAPKPEPFDDKKKSARKSKVNLEAEARAAIAAPDTSPDPVGDTSETPMMRRSRPELGSNDPTFVGNVNDIIKKKAAAALAGGGDEDKTTDEWDAMATQNLTGDELNNLPFPPPSGDGRKTAVALATPDFKSTVQAFPKPQKSPAAAAPANTSRNAVEPHDPGVVTTQAVRVVLWRDGNGVHVAPAGTVVSAITVDAVLVALDSNADLTAWLTQKGR